MKQKIHLWIAIREMREVIERFDKLCVAFMSLKHSKVKT